MEIRTRDEKEEIGRQLVDAVLKVHQALGPGLLESAYQTCLAYELRQRGLKSNARLINPLLTRE